MLKFCKEKKIDFAVMLHGDGQYHPKYIVKMFDMLKNNEKTYAVTGSRMIYRKKR